MSEGYTIGRLAREADVPTSTVRYYERCGLLRPDARSQGNYRLYGAGALERLRFVRSAQAAGFTLSDIRALLQFRDGDAEPCAAVQSIIQQRLGRVRHERAHLQRVEALLERWLRTCRAAQRSGKCVVLEGLSLGGEKPDKNPRKRA